DAAPNPQEITVRVDDLASAISTIQIVGSVETEDREASSSTSQSLTQAGLALKPTGFAATAKVSSSDSRSDQSGHVVKRSGSELVHLNFGNVMGTLTSRLGVLGASRTWLLIDEWSEIPVELQPYLADLIRRTILPVPSVTTKIAAIEHRSDFAI